VTDAIIRATAWAVCDEMTRRRTWGAFCWIILPASSLILSTRYGFINSPPFATADTAASSWTAETETPCPKENGCQIDTVPAPLVPQQAGHLSRHIDLAPLAETEILQIAGKPFRTQPAADFWLRRYCWKTS